MKIVSKILQSPTLWTLSQKIFGDDNEKMKLYRSVIKKPGKLLDFGCANGNTFSIFSEFDYYGFDTDKIMIENAKKIYKNNSKAHFYQIDILKSKSPKSSFDSILFALTGHHLDDNKLLKIFYKLTKLLKPGGKIFYFDSIRTKTDSILLTTLLNLDQGKYIRPLKKYSELMKLLPKNLKMRKSRIYQVKGTFMPQPKYLFWELQKIK